MKKELYRGPIKITLVYLVIGSLWIILSDRLVDSMVTDSDSISNIQTVKGWLYIVVTALILFALVLSDRKKEIEHVKRIEKETGRSRFYLDLLGHDIGNIHQGLNMSLELMNRKMEDSDFVEKMMNSMKGQLRRSMDLSNNVKTLSKFESREPDLEPLNLIETVKKGMRKARTSFPERKITIDFRSPRQELKVMAEPIIEEVFFNLVHNAIKAQPGDAWVGVYLNKHRGKDLVDVSILDKGPGMDRKMRNEVLSGLTTPAMKRKGGLGLPLTSMLVRRYSGTMTIGERVKGDHSSGTSFRIMLPLCK